MSEKLFVTKNEKVRNNELTTKNARFIWEERSGRMATIFDIMRIQKLTNQWEQKKQNVTEKVQEDDRTPEQRQM